MVRCIILLNFHKIFLLLVKKLLNQILMDKNAEGTATITITDNLMDRYGITLEDLHEQALLNMDVL